MTMMGGRFGSKGQQKRAFFRLPNTEYKIIYASDENASKLKKSNFQMVHL